MSDLNTYGFGNSGATSSVQVRNRVLRNTYALLALSMVPTVLGAWIGVATGFSLFAGSPFIGLIGIECAMPPLDRYSLPSGHTLHAVMFTAIAISHVPALAVLLVPFALMVAASRVVLGLHYPTDVLAGALLGALIAQGSNWLF